MEKYMDKLIDMCDELEKENEGYDIESVRKKLKNYIGNDYDKILQLRAEIEKHKNFKEKSLANYSLFFSVSSVIMGIFYNAYSIYNDLVTGSNKYIIGILIIWISISVVAAIILICIIVSLCNSKFEHKRDEWVAYISVVLDDIEKSFELNEKNNIDNKKKDNQNMIKKLYNFLTNH